MRTAVRAGVLDVTVIALESPEEIPADPEEIADAEAEGITILYRKGPHRFVGNGGRVTGLETIDVQAVFDEEGRFNPRFIADTEAVLPADSVILAVGQAADLGVLGGIDLTLSRGGVQVDPATLQIRGLTTRDHQGGESSLTFTNMKENRGLSDNDFVFKVPGGVTVVTDAAR